MKTHVRIAAAMLGSLACFSQAGFAVASDRETNHHRPPGNHLPPGEIIESDIYDPLGLVARGPHGKLVSLAKGFGFTEGPATDRNGNVFFTDQPNDRIERSESRLLASIFCQNVLAPPKPLSRPSLSERFASAP